MGFFGMIASLLLGVFFIAFGISRRKQKVLPIILIALEIGIASWNAPPEKVLIYAGFRGFEDEKIFEFSPSVLPVF